MMRKRGLFAKHVVCQGAQHSDSVQDHNGLANVICSVKTAFIKT